MDKIQVIGRLIVGGYFVMMGIQHFINLKNLSGYSKSKKVPMPEVAVIITGILMLLGGLGVFFNQFWNESILLLIVFLIPTTFVMHAFWNVKDPMQKMNERIAFFKNLAIMGALLMLFV